MGDEQDICAMFSGLFFGRQGIPVCFHGSEVPKTETPSVD